MAVILEKSRITVDNRRASRLVSNQRRTDKQLETALQSLDKDQRLKMDELELERERLLRRLSSDSEEEIFPNDCVDKGRTRRHTVSEAPAHYTLVNSSQKDTPILRRRLSTIDNSALLPRRKNSVPFGFMSRRSTVSTFELRSGSFGGTSPETRKPSMSPEFQKRSTGSPQFRKRSTGSPEIRKRSTGSPEIRKRSTGSPEFRKRSTGSPEFRKRSTASPEFRKRSTGSPEFLKRRVESPLLAPTGLAERRSSVILPPIHSSILGHPLTKPKEQPNSRKRKKSDPTPRRFARSTAQLRHCTVDDVMAGRHHDVSDALKQKMTSGRSEGSIFDKIQQCRYLRQNPFYVGDVDNDVAHLQ